MNYFNKFPLINYNGHTAVNLLTRAQLSKTTRNEKTLFYPYTIRDYDRADNLSENYYDSPEYSWLIWMTNDIVDPYYDYPLSDDDFEAYVTDKYGSIAEANRKIKYYRTKWVNDEGIITPAQFEALDSRYKKYHDPVVDMEYGITGYKRRMADVTVNTNKVVQITLSNRAGEFIKGEEIYKQNNTAVYGECVHPIAYPVLDGDAHIGVQHLVGAFAPNDMLIGKTSGASARVGSINVITETLATTEADYWESVSCYDFEYEINQKKKQIKLLDARYRNQVESELQRVMDTQ